ncbi:phosphatase PAP2 family protein [Hymenobacter sp. BT175]|uniref:phosphatase PAP2 family protein n=1 Tax=Hymenobacter translucens TaxID=2886507 RepID=UPI001D0E9ACE|nr:phosphatase PAP2 family protein [Hymenobacter translucens]MCC2547112.1 phosphatase PAP2 family protein [Hymenobacter translucens]
MKRLFPLFLFASSLTLTAPAQAQQVDSPYNLSWKVDLPVTLGLTAISSTGLYLNLQKEGLTDAEALALDKNNVPKFDRFIAGNYDEGARTISDYLLIGSVAAPPALIALNPGFRGNRGQLAGLFVETMGVTTSIFTMSVGNIYRYRPLTYSSEPKMSERTRANATNSFFAGHTAAAATGTFFTAKIFNDFYPDSPARPYVWAGAALVPAAVAYYRIQAGKHFLSDNIVGYTVGAAVGIVVPQLHKTASRAGISCVPMSGYTPNGYAYSGLHLTKRL